MSETLNIRRRPGWWYPYIFLGVFGVVLAVNLIFMASAIRTFSGLETDQAYEKGLKYNDTLAEARRQEMLGWHAKAEVIAKGARAADIVVTFSDRDGKPVTGLAGQAQFVRPTSSGHDGASALAEQGGGRYVVAANLPLSGQWEMTVDASRGSDTYRFSQRIYLP